MTSVLLVCNYQPQVALAWSFFINIQNSKNSSNNSSNNSNNVNIMIVMIMIRKSNQNSRYNMMQ